MIAPKEASAFLVPLAIYLEAFAEHDPARRTDLLAGCMTADAEIWGPKRVFAGYAAISEKIAGFHRNWPGGRLVLATGINTFGNVARLGNAIVGTDGEVSASGESIVELAEDGRIRRVVAFWDALPPLPDSWPPQLAVPPRPSAGDSIQYRRGTPDDSLCVGVLATQVFLDAYAANGIRPDLAREVLSVCMPEKFAGRLVDRSTHFLLAERTGHLVAFAEVALGGEPPDPAISHGAELVRLYVHPRFHRQGLGRTLLAQAEAMAKSTAAPCLWLTAWAGNRAALAFYAAQGYTDVGATSYVFEGNAYENRIFIRNFTSAP